MKMNRKEVKMI